MRPATHSPTPVNFDVWQDPEQPGRNCFAAFEARVRALAAEPGLRVGDLGGGANPLLDLPFVKERELEYSVFDLSARELEKNPSGYRSVVADLCQEPPPSIELDLAFSKTVCEHLDAPAAFHRNVYSMLRPGGRALHFFPTLFAPPFVVNRILPESLSERLLARLQNGRSGEGSHGKFPARYKWCRGPTLRQLKRLEGIGFSVSAYHGYFGHAYYESVPLLRSLSPRVAGAMARRPIPALTSYAIVELVKPESANA